MRTAGAVVFILLGCANPQAELEAEARRWLTSTFEESNTPTLILRNVRQVGDAVCGEADFEYEGRRTGNRRFFYQTDQSGAFETPIMPPVPPDGDLNAAQRSTRLLISSTCSG